MRWAAIGLLCSSAAMAQGTPAEVGSWTPVTSWPVQPVHAHLLPTGKVFFFSEFHLGAQLYLWDPAGTAPPARFADAPYNLFCAGHAFLPDGRLLLAGGHIADHKGLNDATLLDPFTLTLTRLPDMNAGRWYPTATTLASGDLLVIAGATEDSVANQLPQVWDHRASAWRNLTTALLTLPYYPWSFVAPSGRVFVAGPHANTRWLDTSGTGAWTTGPRTISGLSRTYGTAVSYQPGKVLIVGGGFPPTNTVEAIDLNAPAPAWRAIAPIRQVRMQHNSTLLPDGTVLVTGGHSGPNLDDPTRPVYDTERWDPVTERWTMLAPSSTYRGYHSVALLLPDGRVLSAGGRNKADMQLYSPPYLFRGARPVVSSAPATVDYGQAFPVSTPAPADVARVTWVRLGSVTHAFDENQRFAELSFTRVTGGLQVTAPAAPTLAPPGHYLMFLLNAAGVPSVGRVVRIGGSAPPPPPPPPSGPPEQVVIPYGSTWSYHDGNVDLGAAWRGHGYDDSAWPSGSAQLGFGDGDERTVLRRLSPLQPSVYFRKLLHLDGVPERAHLRVRKDDGVVVWVNGVEVYSHRVGDRAFRAFATSISAENEETEADLPVAPFVQGHNVVAVMVKQSDGTSSDLSFDLELMVTLPVTPHPGYLLTSPNGGEELRSGNPHTVAWMVHGEASDQVKLEYSVDDGVSWRVIASGAPNTGTYQWVVPTAETARARLRISDPLDPMEADTSDAPFTITSANAWRAISFGEYWRYRDDNVDPGPSWTSPSYDDSGWRSGPGQLGYGDGDERTVLNQTSPAQPSLYFRKRMHLAQPIRAASLRLLHDDGVAVWVNGHLVFSRKVDAGLAHAAYASSNSWDNEVTLATIDPGAFRLGENVVAVMVKQAGATSSDASFDLELDLIAGISPPGSAVLTPVPFGADWRYRDDNVDPGPSWTAPSHDDSGWRWGRAELGYGEEDQATALRRTTPSQPSLYFRRRFTLAEVPAQASLTVRFDDGVAVWLNGRLVAARNVGSTAHASYAPAASDDNSALLVELPPDAFLAGENTLAVMVKQDSGLSSDVSFDLSLQVELEQ